MSLKQTLAVCSSGSSKNTNLETMQIYTKKYTKHGHNRVTRKRGFYLWTGFMSSPTHMFLAVLGQKRILITIVILWILSIIINIIIITVTLRTPDSSICVCLWHMKKSLGSRQPRALGRPPHTAGLRCSPTRQ